MIMPRSEQGTVVTASAGSITVLWAMDCTAYADGRSYRYCSLPTMSRLIRSTTHPADQRVSTAYRQTRFLSTRKGHIAVQSLH